MPKEILDFEMTKPQGVSWGIRIGGGVDRGKVLVLEKNCFLDVKGLTTKMKASPYVINVRTAYTPTNIIFNSIACDIGLKDRDFIVDINGTKVFEMSHDECTAFIKKAGNQLNLKIERGDHIVPSMDEAFPKKAKDASETDSSGKLKPYWVQALESGKGARNAAGFTTVGKPKIAQKQYNSPLQMYSEDNLEEMMKEGTVGGKPVDMSNLMNPTGKDFDSNTSDVLALIMERS